jgi:hypothetical protein
MPTAFGVWYASPVMPLVPANVASPTPCAPGTPLEEVGRELGLTAGLPRGNEVCLAALRRVPGR